MNRKKGMTANSLVHLKATDTKQPKNIDRLKISNRQMIEQRTATKKVQSSAGNRIVLTLQIYIWRQLGLSLGSTHPEKDI